MCARERRGLTGGVLQLPGVVVVRSGGVADTPMGHRAVRIDLQRFLEAADSLFMMVAKTRVEATIEPALRIRRSGRHFPGVRAEIIRIVHVAPIRLYRSILEPAASGVGAVYSSAMPQLAMKTRIWPGDRSGWSVAPSRAHAG
jgi:hypothetical protein